MVLYVKIIKKLKKKGGKRKKYIYLYMGINKLKKFWVIKHIYQLIKLKELEACLKRYVLKCLLEMSIEELDLSSSGIEFHGPGPATANVLSPQVFSLAFGVARRCWKEDLNVRSEVR